MELLSPYQRRKSSRKSTSTATSNYRDGEGWSPEEDSLLRDGVCRYGGKKWKTIAERIASRSPEECNRRWDQLQGVGAVTKRPWDANEDDKMKMLVQQYGPSKWSVIASYLPGRNGKQCRERWHNQLNPSIKKTPWTEEENELIINMQASIGNCWAKITAQLPGRTDNAVKNHWHSSLKSLSKLPREGREASTKKRKPGKKTKTSRSKRSARSKKARDVVKQEPVNTLPYHVGPTQVVKQEEAAMPYFDVTNTTRPVTRACDAAAAAMATASGFPRPDSPDTVSSVDCTELKQSFDTKLSVGDVWFPAQAVIDSILDPMGMGTCASDFVSPSPSSGDSTFERCLASWRAGDDEFCSAVSSANLPLDSTSPAQPPFGLDELLYDSFHDLCEDAASSALSGPPNEVYQRSMFTTQWGTVVYPSPPAAVQAPVSTVPTNYVPPDLSPLENVKEEPPPGKSEAPRTYREFVPGAGVMAL